MECSRGSSSQSFQLEEVVGRERGFRWQTKAGRCVEGGPEGVAVRAGHCGEGWWQWGTGGGFRWEGGPGNCTRCLTALDRNKPVSLAFCRAESEDQAVEVGRWRAGEQPGDELLLHPLDQADWAARQSSLRSRLLAAATPGLTAALAELQHAELLHSADPAVTPHSGRRAAVFYLDRGTSGLANLRWWIHAWRDIGLDSEVEKFDLVLLVHPAVIIDLPTDCKLVDGTALPTGPGLCRYKPYVGIAYRDNTFDSYMNSQECLVGPGSEFLEGYSTLLYTV